jgi:hypothetical protein
MEELPQFPELEIHLTPHSENPHIEQVIVTGPDLGSVESLHAALMERVTEGGKRNMGHTSVVEIPDTGQGRLSVAATPEVGRILIGLGFDADLLQPKPPGSFTQGRMEQTRINGRQVMRLPSL